jgi:hypothetical protein
MAWGLFAQQNTVKTTKRNSIINFYFVTDFYRLDNICIVGRKVTKTDMTAQSPDR